MIPSVLIGEKNGMMMPFCFSLFLFSFFPPCHRREAINDYIRYTSRHYPFFRFHPNQKDLNQITLHITPRHNYINITPHYTYKLFASMHPIHLIRRHHHHYLALVNDSLRDPENFFLSH